MRKKRRKIVTRGYKCIAQKFHSSDYECQWMFWKRMQTFLGKTIR